MDWERWLQPTWWPAAILFWRCFTPHVPSFEAELKIEWSLQRDWVCHTAVARQGMAQSDHQSLTLATAARAGDSVRALAENW